MAECTHPVKTKVIDKLGLMTEHGNGEVWAPVLAWHWVCRACGQTVNTLEEKEQQ